jgi:hypothetical protein
MSGKGGIWIDHRSAVIVLLGPGEEARTTHLESHVEKHPEREGDSPLKGPYEARQVPPDDRRERSFMGKLDGYYDAVIEALGDLDALVIFGPGEAKGEFRKRLDKHKLGARVAGVETADKMTDRQITAKVREYFQGHQRR